MNFKLTTAQVRALAAVRDGLVTQRFTANGNAFHGPKGIGPVLYRKLQSAGLIEDARGARTTGVVWSSHRQQLTKAGHDALAAIHGAPK